MKRLFLSFSLLSITVAATAQDMQPLYEAYFSHPDDMVDNDDGPGYHFKVNDTLMVSMSDDGYYKLFNKKGQVLEEGDTDEGDNVFLRHGNWKQYYSNGKVSASGSYFENAPYGHWQFFREDGTPTSECEVVPILASDGTTTYCKAGTEMVYFTSGKIKELRYYIAEPYQGDSRIKVEDPDTGKTNWTNVKVKAFRPKPFGTWTYYNEDGTIEKREDKK